MLIEREKNSKFTLIWAESSGGSNSSSVGLGVTVGGFDPIVCDCPTNSVRVRDPF
jgi:hypothetical protein